MKKIIIILFFFTSINPNPLKKNEYNADHIEELIKQLEENPDNEQIMEELCEETELSPKEIMQIITLINSAEKEVSNPPKSEALKITIIRAISKHFQLVIYLTIGFIVIWRVKQYLTVIQSKESLNLGKKQKIDSQRIDEIEKLVILVNLLLKEMETTKAYLEGTKGNGENILNRLTKMESIVNSLPVQVEELRKREKRKVTKKRIPRKIDPIKYKGSLSDNDEPLGSDANLSDSDIPSDSKKQGLTFWKRKG